jgi:adenylate cyclase
MPTKSRGNHSHSASGAALPKRESVTEITPPVPAVLFADVSGWTDLTSRVGDETALALRDKLFRPLKKIVQKHRGWVVKTLGDGLMCMFKSPQAAARAARDMQRHAERANRNAKEPLPLRMGMHAGQVIVKNKEVEGNTVNIAARVAAASKPERILLTRSVAELLQEDLSGVLRMWRNEVLKGQEESFELYELNWRADSDGVGTVFSRPTREKEAQYKRLTLRCQDKVCVLESGTPPLTFGRSPHNRLVIDDPEIFVSGSHGKIEIIGGNMVLTDNSRNGIFIAFGEGRFFLVDRTVFLRASGRMTLGRSPTYPDAIFAEFDLE